MRSHPLYRQYLQTASATEPSARVQLMGLTENAAALCDHAHALIKMLKDGNNTVEEKASLCKSAKEYLEKYWQRGEPVGLVPLLHLYALTDEPLPPASLKVLCKQIAQQKVASVLDDTPIFDYLKKHALQDGECAYQLGMLLWQSLPSSQPATVKPITDQSRTLVESSAAQTCTESAKSQPATKKPVTDQLSTAVERPTAQPAAESAKLLPAAEASNPQSATQPSTTDQVKNQETNKDRALTLFKAAHHKEHATATWMVLAHDPVLARTRNLYQTLTAALTLTRSLREGSARKNFLVDEHLRTTVKQALAVMGDRPNRDTSLALAHCYVTGIPDLIEKNHAQAVHYFKKAYEKELHPMHVHAAFSLDAWRKKMAALSTTAECAHAQREALLEILEEHVLAEPLEQVAEPEPCSQTSQATTAKTPLASEKKEKSEKKNKAKQKNKKQSKNKKTPSTTSHQEQSAQDYHNELRQSLLLLIQAFRHEQYAHKNDTDRLSTLLTHVNARFGNKQALTKFLEEVKINTYLESEQHARAHPLIIRMILSTAHAPLIRGILGQLDKLIAAERESGISRVQSRALTMSSLIDGLSAARTTQSAEIASFFLYHALKDLAYELHPTKLDYHTHPTGLFNPQNLIFLLCVTELRDMHARFVSHVEFTAPPFIKGGDNLHRLKKEIKGFLDDKIFADIEAQDFLGLLKRVYALLCLLIDSDYTSEGFQQGVATLSSLAKNDRDARNILNHLVRITTNYSRLSGTEDIPKKLALNYTLMHLAKSIDDRVITLHAMALNLSIAKQHPQLYAEFMKQHDLDKEFWDFLIEGDEIAIFEKDLKLWAATFFYLHYQYLANQAQNAELKTKFHELADAKFDYTLKRNVLSAHISLGLEYLEASFAQADFKKGVTHFITALTCGIKYDDLSEINYIGVVKAMHKAFRSLLAIPSAENKALTTELQRFWDAFRAPEGSKYGNILFVSDLMGHSFFNMCSKV